MSVILNSHSATHQKKKQKKNRSLISSFLNPSFYCEKSNRNPRVSSPRAWRHGLDRRRTGGGAAQIKHRAGEDDTRAGFSCPDPLVSVMDAALRRRPLGLTARVSGIYRVCARSRGCWLPWWKACRHSRGPWPRTGPTRWRGTARRFPTTKRYPHLLPGHSRGWWLSWGFYFFSYFSFFFS